MDDARFDRLTRAWDRTVNRRQGVRGLLAGLAAVAAGATAPEAEAAGPSAQRCLGEGVRCGKGSGKNGGPCKKCCSRYAIRARNGKRRCTCRKTGQECGNHTQCCSKQCDRTTGRCAGGGSACVEVNGACAGSGECCGNLSCRGGTCRFPCAGVLGDCETDADCCTGYVCDPQAKACAPRCRTAGQPCGQGCCADHLCAVGSATCVQCPGEGEPCVDGSRCCDGQFCDFDTVTCRRPTGV